MKSYINVSLDAIKLISYLCLPLRITIMIAYLNDNAAVCCGIDVTAYLIAFSSSWMCRFLRLLRSMPGPLSVIEEHRSIHLKFGHQSLRLNKFYIISIGC